MLEHERRRFGRLLSLRLKQPMDRLITRIFVGRLVEFLDDPTPLALR